jgi:SAM-dependent methyltransferase
VSCAVCGAASARSKLRKGGVEILECPCCGLAYWTPPPDFCPKAIYDGEYFEDAATGRGYDDYGGLEGSLRMTFARRLAQIPLPRTAARLLDLGAAFGFAVAEARGAGWDATGLEISPAAARRASRAAAGRVVIASAEATPFAPEVFDAVTLWDVLEHLPDPHSAMAELTRILRPGGRILLSTGDVGSLAARLSGARWHLYTLPEHLFFHSRRSLRLLLETHGFRVESLRAESSVYTLGYLVERLRKTIFRRPARASARWPGSDLRIPINLFDIVTARAVLGPGA